MHDWLYDIRELYILPHSLFASSNPITLRRVFLLTYKLYSRPVSRISMTLTYYGLKSLNMRVDHVFANMLSY